MNGPLNGPMTRSAAAITRRLLLSAALGWAAPSTAAPAVTDWSPYPAFWSRCETTRIDAGTPEARWALGDGVYEDERDKRGSDFAWTSRRWQARLLLTAPGERTLRLTGNGPPQQALRAFWNGVDLGRRQVGRGRVSLTWEVPAGASRIGLNNLRFEAATARQRVRQLSFRLESLEVEPADPDCGAVAPASAGDVFTLDPGAVLLAQRPLPPRTELQLELDGESGSRIELYLGRNGVPQRRVDLAAAGERRIERLELGDLLSNELVAVARGPGTVSLRLVEVSGDESQAAWRAACGLLWKVPPAAAGLVALLALAVLAGRRWPGGRRTVWLDCGLLLVLALALRFAFLAAYPALDATRFGDSWEYLQRSRHLLRGAPFWSDTSWHAWLTWIRPPGYYLMLAAVLGPLGGGLALLGKVQAVLLAATAAAGYLAAYPLFGRGTALAAGLLIAVYPQTITSATWILSDPPALFLTTAALACLSWLAVRPRWPLALGTGALFGVGCLVRSAPLYFVPLAALLLFLAARGRTSDGRAPSSAAPGAGAAPRRWSPALALVAGTMLVVLPWCIRNSVLYGKPMGIDDLMIPNFLMAHPDPQILPAELEKAGVWGEAERTREEYFRKLWRSNKDHRLTLESGSILGRGLLRMAASPGATLARFGLHLKIYFQAFPRLYSAHFLGETEGCRVSAWTDALNLVYLLTLVLAVPGALLALRHRQAWPLVAWILYFVVVTNLFFYPSYMPGRYRLPIYPALAVLAGLTLSRAAGALAAYRARRLPGAGG